jgi:protein-S-isoprenylcysteine O-methyltransferase Ste14
MAAELRQALKRRPEAPWVEWGSETVLRVAVVAGVLVAVLAERKVPAAAIGPAALAAWLGLVISDGPYRVLRHPSYAGSLLAVIGIGMFLGNWLSVLALTLGLLIRILYRIRVEGQALLRELGDPYRDYAATRKRLVPYVW